MTSNAVHCLSTSLFLLEIAIDSIMRRSRFQVADLITEASQRALRDARAANGVAFEANVSTMSVVRCARSRSARKRA